MCIRMDIYNFFDENWRMKQKKNFKLKEREISNLNLKV